MNLRASIDIGSNSILLLVAKVEGENITILENESNVTGLGRDLDKNGEFIQAAMDDSEQVLAQYAKICENHQINPQDIIITATEASRVAKNASTFYQRIKEKYGLKVLIITGEAEAHYSATGILFDKNIADSKIIIMDIGGASTELIEVETNSQKIKTSFSMPVGAVRMNNWHFEGHRSDSLEKVLLSFDQKIASVKTTKLYCVAGTMTSIGNMYLENKSFVENQVNGLEFSSEEIDLMYEKYKNFKPEQFLEKFPFLGKRSKTILSGILLAQSILKRLNATEVYISTYGLRYGTLLAGEIDNDFIRN